MFVGLFLEQDKKNLKHIIQWDRIISLPKKKDTTSSKRVILLYCDHCPFGVVVVVVHEATTQKKEVLENTHAHTQTQEKEKEWVHTKRAWDVDSLRRHSEKFQIKF